MILNSLSVVSFTNHSTTQVGMIDGQRRPSCRHWLQLRKADLNLPNSHPVPLIQHPHTFTCSPRWRQSSVVSIMPVIMTTSNCSSLKGARSYGSLSFQKLFNRTAHHSFLIVLYYTACVNPILQRKKHCTHSRTLDGSRRDASHQPAVNKGTGSGCN